MTMFNRKLKSNEYLELKQDLEKLRIEFISLELELKLVIKKLKFKYKITTREDQEQNINSSVLLPDDGKS